MATSIARWGSSLAVRIPKQEAERAGLVHGTTVEIYAEGGRVIIARCRPRYTLAALVEQITPENMTPEVDFGEPEGREVW